MKILVAEDNPVFQSMLKNMLSRWDYDVLVTDSGEKAWRLLQPEDAPRLAILDWMMPGLDGIEVCRRVRAISRQQYIYVILLTARTEQKDLVEGMDAGADDYVTKPFNTQELRVRIRAGQRILDLHEQLLAAQEALREQATRDGLTGLWNRTTVLDILQREAARAERDGTPLAVLMLDLDYFKSINDAYGHLSGDAVLRETGRRLALSVRTYDAVGRYGGEEFLVVLPGCDELDAIAQCERLRDAIAGKPFSTPAGDLSVTCSLGLAWTPHPLTAAIKRLLHDADSSLYAAKRLGRNRVEIAPPDASAVLRV
jgi:diguanylate cyclase (GGDEF)-like protein